MSYSEEQRRRELMGGVGLSVRSWREAVVAAQGALLEGRGLSVVEERALGIVERQGPLTAGELGRLVGLAPASVTGLVDRLARRGFVRRVQGAEDKRQVLIEGCSVTDATAPLLEELQGEQERLLAGYSVKQLETLYHFLTESARLQRVTTEKLSKIAAQTK